MGPMQKILILCFIIAISTIAQALFSNEAATAETNALSLHDALPISSVRGALVVRTANWSSRISNVTFGYCFSNSLDRKSTRLNSSHVRISYAVFCLKQKKQLRSHKSQFRFRMRKQKKPLRLPVFCFR